MYGTAPHSHWISEDNPDVGIPESRDSRYFSGSISRSGNFENSRFSGNQNIVIFSPNKQILH